MKRFVVLFFAVMFLLGFSIIINNVSFAKEKVAREDFIRNAYRQILTETDKNKDGKISMNECMSISRDKKKIEKDCKYWDADGNGNITEDEYVKQVIKIMR